MASNISSKFQNQASLQTLEYLTNIAFLTKVIKVQVLVVVDVRIKSAARQYDQSY
jgi:hypothetical protein